MWIALAKPTFFLSGKSCGSGAETRLTSIMRKANLRSTVDLIRYAIWAWLDEPRFLERIKPPEPMHYPAFPSTRLGISLTPECSPLCN